MAIPRRGRGSNGDDTLCRAWLGGAVVQLLGVQPSQPRYTLPYLITGTAVVTIFGAKQTQFSKGLIEHTGALRENGKKTTQSKKVARWPK